MGGRARVSSEANQIKIAFRMSLDADRGGPSGTRRPVIGASFSIPLSCSNRVVATAG
jgi:hypothetical protein